MTKQTAKQNGLFIFILISLVFFNCQNPLHNNIPKEEEPEIKPPAGRGIVRLAISGWMDDIPARTIFPAEPVFSSYLLSFTPKNGQSSKENIIIDMTGVIKDIDLDAGEWLITAYGRVIFEGQEETVAEGSETVNVIADENIEVSIKIRSKPLESEEGLFTWTLIVPDNVEADSLSITLSEWGNETNRVINRHENITGHNGETIITGSQLCENGYYLLHISIGTDRQRVFYFSVVHIRGYATTSYAREVSYDEFVPVIILDGSVNVSVTLDGINAPAQEITLREVWVYSSAGERVGYANIKADGTWLTRIVKPHAPLDLYFSVILTYLDNQLELKNEEIYHQAYQNDISAGEIKIRRELLKLFGTLDPRTIENFPNSDWEVKAYTESAPVPSINELPVKTNAGGGWSMIIDAFDTPEYVYFSVEKIINGKRYKRVNLNRQSVSNSPVNIINIKAFFTPPVQVWIRGNIFPDGNSRSMLSYNGRFTFTRNNTSTDQNPHSFNILVYFENGVFDETNWNQLSESIVNYNYQDVIRNNAGLPLYNDNGAIAWDIDLPGSRPVGRDNVMITLDFRNNEYFDESATPVLKVERRSEVYINGGTFTMGSPSSENGRNGPSGMSSEVQHPVLLNAFYMMPEEVTQKTYESLMPVPSYKNTGGNDFRSAAYPVVNISWFNALEFANRLSEMDGLKPVYTITGTGTNRNVTVDWSSSGWRLPTEAEWEYAARAGGSTTFAVFFDGNGNSLNNGNILNNSIANYNSLAVDGYNPVSGIPLNCITEVYRYYPNNWGLKNMHGNVWEFCWDWYGDYITTGTQIDPRGPVSGTSNITGTDADAVRSRNQRIIRGGSYFTTTRYLRSAHRGVIGTSDNTYNDIGFRLVRKQ